MKQIKLNPSTVDRIVIERRSNGDFDIITETNMKKTYFLEYNKVTDTSTLKSGFTATKIEDIVAYAKELK